MKKLVAVLTCAIMAMALTACGGSSEPSNTIAEENTTEAVQTVSSAAENPLIKAVEEDNGLGRSTYTDENGQTVEWSYFQLYRADFDALTDAQITEYINTLVKDTGVAWSSLFFSDDDNGLQIDGSLQWIKFGPIDPDGIVESPTATYTMDANGNFTR